jgi:hypothetical protein
MSLVLGVRPSKQPLIQVRTFLKVYMELGSYFLFRQEQIKDIIIIMRCRHPGTERVHPEQHVVLALDAPRD